MKTSGGPIGKLVSPALGWCKGMRAKIGMPEKVVRLRSRLGGAAHAIEPEPAAKVEVPSAPPAAVNLAPSPAAALPHPSRPQHRLPQYPKSQSATRPQPPPRVNLHLVPRREPVEYSKPKHCARTPRSDRRNAVSRSEAAAVAPSPAPIKWIETVLPAPAPPAELRHPLPHQPRKKLHGSRRR